MKSANSFVFNFSNMKNWDFEKFMHIKPRFLVSNCITTTGNQKKSAHLTNNLITNSNTSTIRGRIQSKV